MLGATAMIQAVDAVHAPVVKAPRHWFCVRPHVSTFGQLRLDVCDVRIKGYKHLLDSDQLWIMRLNWRTQRHKILNVNISSYTIKFIDFFFLTINSEKVWYMGWKSEPKWAVFYETICRQFNSFRRPNCNPCYANCKSSYPPFTQISEKVKGIYIHRQELSVPSISVPRLQH
jgi:hypothetical protein